MSVRPRRVGASPGCPPSADAIWEALVALLNNKPIYLSGALDFVDDDQPVQIL